MTLQRVLYDFLVFWYDAFCIGCPRLVVFQEVQKRNYSAFWMSVDCEDSEYGIRDCSVGGSVDGWMDVFRVLKSWDEWVIQFLESVDINASMHRHSSTVINTFNTITNTMPSTHQHNVINTIRHQHMICGGNCLIVGYQIWRKNCLSPEIASFFAKKLISPRKQTCLVRVWKQNKNVFHA